jgi:hypothetical protein
VVSFCCLAWMLLWISELEFLSDNMISLNSVSLLEFLYPYLYMSPSFDTELLKSCPLIAEFVYLWSVLLDLYNIWAIFLYVVYVFEFFCLWKFMLTQWISEYPWTSLKYRGYLYTCFLRGFLTCYITRPNFTWLRF